MKNTMNEISKETSEITDIVEMVRNGPVGNVPVPEQEVYFDAGHTPSPHRWTVVREEMIDGVKYMCYS